MRIAVVMPRGGTMCRRTVNSMETVAHTLRRHSRQKSATRIICDAGAAEPLEPDLVTVPVGLGKGERADAVAKVLLAYVPDYIDYHQQLESAAALARRFPDKVNVLYRHTRIKPPRDPISRMRYQARLKAFDHLVFVSEAAVAEFLADYPAFSGRVSAVCNPIDSAPWHGDPERREKLILFSGRAMKEKGLEPFCAALATVLDRRPDWHGALMLGDWEKHKDWAEPVVRTLDRFGGRVEIHRSAPLADVMAMTKRAAIAVAPSFVAEALGLTALEAHAAGAALISSGRGGLREASGPHAVYVDPPEADGLTRALSDLIADPARRVALGKAGQAWIAEVHSAPVRAAQVDDLRERLLAEPKPAAAPNRASAATLIQTLLGGLKQNSGGAAPRIAG